LQKETSEREMKEKISELMLQHERMLQAERKGNAIEVKKLHDSLKEKNKKTTSVALERSIIVVASEKEAKENNEELQRAADITSSVTIYDSILAYNAVKCFRYHSPDPLLALYERIMSLSDEELRREIGISDERHDDSVFQIAAFNQFPHAALSRLLQCGCDIDAVDKLSNTAIISATENSNAAVVDNLALLGADLSKKDSEGTNLLQLSDTSLELSYLCDLHGRLKERTRNPCWLCLSSNGYANIREWSAQ
jgi:ankyrin repeat protein